MTSSPVPLASLDTFAVIAAAVSGSASFTHPLYGPSDLGIDSLEFDVHVVATRWSAAGALALCGEVLESPAAHLAPSLPMCWECAEILDPPAPGLPVPAGQRLAVSS